MAFEKEKKINTLIMAAGAVLMIAGIAVYFLSSRLAGVTVSILGMALLVIGFTVQSVFYQMKMMEILGFSKKTNRK